MSKVFGILTIAILVLSGYIAFKNKAAYDQEVTKVAEQKASLAKKQAMLVESTAKVAGLGNERTEAEAEGENLVEVEATLGKENEALKAQAETKTAKLAADKAKLDEIREKTSKLGNIKELASKLAETNQELEALSQEITGAEAALADYTGRSTRATDSVEFSRKALEDYGTGQSLVTLNTRIRTIYPDWGFVTLTGGNNAGVVGNSTLDIVRGGQTIAKLLVTAVERNTSAASVIPGTLAPDTTIRVGDKVVRGEKASSQPAATTPNGPAS